MDIVEFRKITQEKADQRKKPARHERADVVAYIKAENARWQTWADRAIRMAEVIVQAGREIPDIDPSSPTWPGATFSDAHNIAVMIQQGRIERECAEEEIRDIAVHKGHKIEIVSDEYEASIVCKTCDVTIHVVSVFD